MVLLKAKMVTKTGAYVLTPKQSGMLEVSRDTFLCLDKRYASRADLCVLDYGARLGDVTALAGAQLQQLLVECLLLRCCTFSDLISPSKSRRNYHRTSCRCQLWLTSLVSRYV